MKRPTSSSAPVGGHRERGHHRGPLRRGVRRLSLSALTVVLAVPIGGVLPLDPAGAEVDVALTWVSRTVPAQEWMSVATDGAGTWVAVSYAGGILRSTDDGATFETLGDEARPAGANQLWSVATDGTGRWLIVRDTSTHRLLVSDDDGATWELSDAIPERSWRSIAYGNGVWIAVSATNSTTTQNVVRSTDGGLTWTTVTTSGGQWRATATDGDGVWVAVNAFTSSNAIIRSADDGETWSVVVNAGSDVDVDGLTGVAADGDGTWVATAGGGAARLVRSTDDGETWSPATTGPVDLQMGDAAFGRGVWTAVSRGPSSGSSSDRVFRSLDRGDQWSAVAPVDGAPPANSWRSIAYGNGVWVAVAGSGAERLMTSGEPIPPPPPPPPPPVDRGRSAPSTPVLVDGAAPVQAPGAAELRMADGTSRALIASDPAPGRVRYEAEGVTVVLSGGRTAGPGPGLVADVGGEIVCEVCMELPAGGVIEVWMFSTPRLVAAHRTDHAECHLFRIPLGSPLDGDGPIGVGAHTLQLAVPTAVGIAAFDIGVTVGGPVPVSVPAGSGPWPPGRWLLLAGVALLAPLVARSGTTGGGRAAQQRGS